MAYRKFKADFLFTGHEMLDSNAVLVTDQNGIVETILSDKTGDDIETFKGILSPAFVNCHCHLELSHMKGLIPEKIGLVDFLLSVIKQRNFSADIIQQAIEDAEKEMIENGMIAVGDICNTTDTRSQKNQGNLCYHNFIETIGFPESLAEQRFQSSVEIFNQFAQQYSLPIESNSIVPHAPYSVSKKLFDLIANFAGNHVLSIHNQESEEENNFIKSGEGDLARLYKSLGLDISFFKPTGKRSLENYLPNFYKNQSLILVHNVATNEEDMKAVGSWQLAVGSQQSEVQSSKFRVGSSELHSPTENWKLKTGNFERSATNYKQQTTNLFFCLCPNANQYISGKLPDIDLLIKHDCRIVIGTDSLASNHQLDILEELKTIQRNFPHIQTKALLQWATLNGGYALQLDNVIGSFEKGKKAGVVLIENISTEKLTEKSKAKRII